MKALFGLICITFMLSACTVGTPIASVGLPDAPSVTVPAVTTGTMTPITY